MLPNKFHLQILKSCPSGKVPLEVGSVRRRPLLISTGHHGIVETAIYIQIIQLSLRTRLTHFFQLIPGSHQSSRFLAYRPCRLHLSERSLSNGRLLIKMRCG